MSDSNNDLALQSLVESLQETLRKERIRTETLELENAQLHARVLEFEASPTEPPPPPSERSTERSNMLQTVIRELQQFRTTSAHLATMIETNLRMSTEIQRMVTDDLPSNVEHAVALAAANLKVEFGTELQKAKTKAYEASEAAKHVEEKCASCPHWREAS
jgi:hypothetical protein